MEEKEEYSHEEFISDLKKMSSAFNSSKSDMNTVLKLGIMSYYYKTSKGRIEKQISCSCVPVIRMFCQIVGIGRSKTSEFIRRIEDNERDQNGKRGISTFSLIYHKPQTIQNDRMMKRIDYFKIDPSRIGEIKRLMSTLKNIAKYEA